MKSLTSQKCIREGGFFLTVGVGDNVFACKSMFYVSRVCSLLVPYPKTTSGQNAVNILLNCADHVRMLCFFFLDYVLKIDAELFSE